MYRVTLTWLGYVLLGLAAAAASGDVAADLMLHPTRVLFDKNQRTAQLDLINNGTETVTYRVSLINRRMSETGEFFKIDAPVPGEQFVNDMLRYSPRQVVLEPGAAQTVRLLLRKPGGLAPGEYRSHLMFERVPDAPAPQSQAKPGEEGLDIKLKALISVSIPVIVRHGETAASVAITNVELQRPAPAQPPLVSFAIQRSGNRSVYGDLVVGFAREGGAEQQVGGAKGVAVYTPNPVRRAKLALTPPPGGTLARGSLRIVYSERPEDGGRTLAEAVLRIP